MTEEQIRAIVREEIAAARRELSIVMQDEGEELEQHVKRSIDAVLRDPRRRSR